MVTTAPQRPAPRIRMLGEPSNTADRKQHLHRRETA
jgi:hypothetical protein